MQQNNENKNISRKQEYSYKEPNDEQLSLHEFIQEQESAIESDRREQHIKSTNSPEKEDLIDTIHSVLGRSKDFESIHQQIMQEEQNKSVTPPPPPVFAPPTAHPTPIYQQPQPQVMPQYVEPQYQQPQAPQPQYIQPTYQQQQEYNQPQYQQQYAQPQYQQQQQPQHTYMHTVQAAPNQNQSDYDRSVEIYNWYVQNKHSFDNTYNIDSPGYIDSATESPLYNASLWKSVKRFFKKSFNTKGYASRSEFIKSMAFVNIGGIAAIIGAALVLPSFGVFTLITMSVAFGMLLSIPAMISVTIRRLRDAGLSPFLFALLLIPSVGTFILTLLASFSPTQAGLRTANNDDPAKVRKEIKKIIKEEKDRLKKQKRQEKNGIFNKKIKEEDNQNKHRFDPDLL